MPNQHPIYAVSTMRKLSSDERRRRASTAVLNDHGGQYQFGVLKCCGAKELHGLNSFMIRDPHCQWKPESILAGLIYRARIVGSTNNPRIDYGVLFMNHKCPQGAVTRPHSDLRGLIREAAHTFTFAKADANSSAVHRITGSKRFNKLARFIKVYKLGTLTISDPWVNPNSGNYIITAVWVVNRANLLNLMRFYTGVAPWQTPS